MEYNEYFEPVLDYFWQSEEQEGVFSIPGSRTIAYRDFVADVLKHLSPQGIPPFGALLLAIIATNPNGVNDIATVKKIVQANINDAGVVPMQLVNYFEEAITFLELLGQLPKQYKQGKNRVLVYQALFERCHNILSVKKSAKIINQYSVPDEYKEHRTVITTSSRFNADLLDRDFKTIALLRSRFKSVDDIIARIVALPEEPVGLELDEEDEQETGRVEVKDLIDELIDNSKTFHVGSLVRRIWSGLNIPLHSKMPSRQPLGGVSDLTNKGDFDKLLISEFANDDLLFLSRLANNEALYLNRETPPEQNDMHRVILIDVSIKNWGTPKSVAFATMLAIARHPKTDITCSAYVVGNGYHPVSIDSVDRLVEGLQFLDAGLHAAKGLAEFFKEYPSNDNREVFVITTPSTLKNSDMLRAVHELHNQVNYWIHTDAEGNIDVYKKQQSSKKHTQHIQLPLADLWKKPPKEKIRQTRDYPIHDGYPVLFRLAPNGREILYSPAGDVYNITTEQTILKFYDRGAEPNAKGWELLKYEVEESSAKFAMGEAEDGAALLLMFSIQHRIISLLNLSTGHLSRNSFQSWKVSPYNNFIFRNGFFYYLEAAFYWRISTNGIIEKCVEPQGGLYSYFNEQENALQQLKGRFKTKTPVLKNVTAIFINQLNNLVFNVHELMITNASFIKIEKSGFLNQLFVAEKVSDNLFRFADGSSVEVNRNGMLVLKSSNDNIPTIYIPSIIEATIGVAAGDVFAGNDYYYKNKLVHALVDFKDAGKLEIVKILMEYRVGVGLKELKEASYSKWMPIPIKHDANVSLMKSRIEALGAEVKFEYSDKQAAGIGMERVGAKDFFARFINEFIKHIMAHGA